MSRIRANQITNQSADGAPTVQNGLIISGVTTSTTFSGSGASLTNIPSAQLTGALPALDGSNLTNITSTTINNNADNRVITGSGSANTLEGEATLTFTNSGSAAQLNLKRSTSSNQEAIFYYGSSNLEIETREATGIKLKTNTSDRLTITSDGNIGVGGITSPLWTSGGGIHLNDNYGIGFGNGGSGRPDFQLMVTDGSKLEFRCGFGADTADIVMDTSGRLLVGTTTQSISSSELFEVKSSASGFSHFRNNSSSYAPIYIDNEYSDTGFAPLLTFTDGGGNRGGIGQDNTDLLRITGQGGVTFYTAGTHGSGSERLLINQNGQVTQPAQPSFAVGKSGNAYQLNGQVMPFDATRHNTGSHFNTSNYRFTAPVAGRYLFTFHSIIDGSINSSQQHYSIRVNNSVSRGMNQHMTPATSNWDQVSSSYILELSANDYVTMFSDSNTRWHGNDWQLFCGQLLS